MATPRIRLDLVPSSATAEDHRSWVLKVDGEDAGTLEATRAPAGDDVIVSVVVAEHARRRGVARSAVGRLLGLAPWGPEIRYVAVTAPSDEAGVALATGLGFLPDGIGVDGARRWTRSAPRPRAGAGDITRYLTADGRIDRYPLRTADRRELLAWVVARALPVGAVLDEAAVNALLEPFAPGGDVAVLRRYLVDHELVERTPSGSEYLRTD